MREILKCIFIIGILIIGALVVWGLFYNSSDMSNGTEQDWIENYEGDADDSMWH
jgi:hypothetical protein